MSWARLSADRTELDIHPQPRWSTMARRRSSIRVDLSAPGPADARRRHFEWLDFRSHELLEAGHLDTSEVMLIDHELLFAVEGCVLLTEAYEIDKRERLEEIEPDREHAAIAGPDVRAALLTLSLMVLRPFRLVAPLEPLHHPLSPVANQVLALEAASTVLENTFPALEWESQRRLFGLLGEIGHGRRARLRSRVLDAYLADRSRGMETSVYWIDLDRDRTLIDSLILLFESPLRPRR